MTENVVNLRPAPTDTDLMSCPRCSNKTFTIALNSTTDEANDMENVTYLIDCCVCYASVSEVIPID